MSAEFFLTFSMLALLDLPVNAVPIAVALGNPGRTRFLDGETIWEDEEDVTIYRSELKACMPEPGEPELADAGCTSFLYQVDKMRYGPVYLIEINYSWNMDELYCLENDILLETGRIDLPTFRHKIFKRIKTLLPVTALQIKTVLGSLKISRLPPEPSLNKTYPQIPDSLTLCPRIPISTLQKCPVKTVHHDIDIVTLSTDLAPCQPWYVFKRYALTPERERRPMNELLLEVEHMSRFDSPHIMKPSFLVTDNSGTLLRGYLMPFMPAGTLFDVLKEIKTDGYLDLITTDPVFLHPRHIHPSESRPREFCPEHPPTRPSAPQLPWSAKHTWAIEATSGLVMLHESGVHTGDIKLENILLDREGHLQHIDIAPQTRGYTHGYMAPEFDTSDKVDELPQLPCPEDPPCANLPEAPVFPLTAERDVFALGIVLWQIAEEDMRIDREDMAEPPRLTWRAGDVEGATPVWYRELVGLCVDCEPVKRPSARDILDILEAGLKL